MSAMTPLEVGMLSHTCRLRSRPSVAMRTEPFVAGVGSNVAVQGHGLAGCEAAEDEAAGGTRDTRDEVAA